MPNCERQTRIYEPMKGGNVKDINVRLTEEEYTELMTALGVRSAVNTDLAIADKSPVGGSVYRRFAQMCLVIQKKIEDNTVNV